MEETQKQNLPAVRQASNEKITAFSSEHGFVSAQRMANALASSDMVPDAYRLQKYDKKSNRWEENPFAIGNCLIALEMSQRLNIPVCMITQSLNVIGGRPSWASAFIEATISSCGRFSGLRYDEVDGGTVVVGSVKLPHNLSCTAWAYELSTKEKIFGVTITLEMAVREGWYGRNPKWQSMPQNMLRKRAASFFGRSYAADLLCGMHSTEELADAGIISEPIEPKKSRFMPIVIDAATQEPEGTPDGILTDVVNEPAGESTPEPATKPDGVI